MARLLRLSIASLLCLACFTTHAQIVINFESLAAPATGNPPLTLGNQLSAQGVTFNLPALLDYTAMPGLARSGTKAIELCYGKEFCGGELEINFNVRQQHVKIWVGFNGPLARKQKVVMKGFNVSGIQFLTSSVELPANAARFTAISFPLELNSPGTGIKAVVIALENTDLLTSNLLFDDLEFDVAGPSQPCVSPVLPQLLISAPNEGQIFTQNVFTLDATATSGNAFAQYELSATNDAGNTKKMNPTFLTSSNLHLGGLTSFLFPGRNVLRLNIVDCAGSTELTRTVFFRDDVKQTVIRVIDQNGADVPEADVYGPDFLGKTNFQGRLTVTPGLADGVLLSARKKVFQKGNGDLYLYRVYQTSMAVDNNGVIQKKPVVLEPDPTAEQVLQVLPSNSLTAFHVWTSIEWDASEAELQDIRDHFDSASVYLYNATDGQFMFETVNISDDGVGFDDRIDYRIYGDWDHHAKVQNLWDFAAGGIEPYVIHMARPITIGARSTFSDFDTYIHEYSHFKFRNKDEYKDDRDNPRICTDKPAGAFQVNMPQASCLMERQWLTPKFCSKRPENPHKDGTKQGDEDCWSRIVRHFKDSDNPPRWVIKTPDSRGAIVGLINNGRLPHKEWLPRHITFNRRRPNLCQPMVFVKIDEDGNRLRSSDLWLHTTYGADILQGPTGPNGEGISCTGLHMGDNVSGFVINAAACKLDNTVSAPRAFSVQVLVERALVTIEPGTASRQFLVRLRLDSVQLKKWPNMIPRIFYSKENSREQINIPLQFNSTLKEYSGKFNVTGNFHEGKLIVLYKLGEKQSRLVTSFSVESMVSNQPLEITTRNVTVELPANALPAKATVVVGPSNLNAPLLKEKSVLAMPIVKITASGNSAISKEAVLTFMPVNTVQGKNNQVNSYQLLHYNEKSKKWEQVKSTLLPVGEVIAVVKELGSYVLVSSPN
jgi:hypothetical protein